MAAAADVEDIPRRLRYLQRQAAGLDDIIGADEVTALIAILIYQGGFPFR
jgi:hypothetical protein